MTTPHKGLTRRDWLRHVALAAAASGTAWTGASRAAEVDPGAAAAAPPLLKTRLPGTLQVAVYADMPPFHADGQGIDVDLAQALADSLGLKLALLPFHADDSMNDDLRNMVWRGHYLGYGPADVLMHVPVERPLIDANPQATIFAPYYRERICVARTLSRWPKLESLSALAGEPIAVPGQTMAGWLLLGADGGAYKDKLVTHWKDGTECAQALKRGDFTVAAGLASELESVLRGDPRFAIEPLPAARAPRNGWATGLAVKSGADDLASALQGALNGLAHDGRLKALFERRNVDWRAA